MNEDSFRVRGKLVQAVDKCSGNSNRVYSFFLKVFSLIKISQSVSQILTSIHLHLIYKKQKQNKCIPSNQMA